MSQQIQDLILTKVSNIESDLTDIKIDVAKNTKDLETHIKRTDDLQLIVTDVQKLVDPLYNEYITNKAVLEYKYKIEEEKKRKREDLIYKLRLPAYLVAAITAIGTIITWLGYK